MDKLINKISFRNDIIEFLFFSKILEKGSNL